jgi:hypothetical protein
MSQLMRLIIFSVVVWNFRRHFRRLISATEIRRQQRQRRRIRRRRFDRVERRSEGRRKSRH